MATDTDKLARMFRLLNKHADFIAEVANSKSMPQTENAFKSFADLRRYNLVFETATGQIRLVSHFQKFIDQAFNVDRTQAFDANIGGFWEAILHNIEGVKRANNQGFHHDSERYFEMLSDNVHELIYNLRSSIDQLRSRLDNNFGYIDSIAARRKENEHAIGECQRLIQQIEIVDFDHLNELVGEHRQMKSLIILELQKGHEYALFELTNALRRMRSLLVGFRQLEAKAQMVKRFRQYFNQHASADFSDLSEQQAVPQLLNRAAPATLALHADPHNKALQSELVELVERANFELNDNPTKTPKQLGDFSSSNEDESSLLSQSEIELWLDDCLSSAIESAKPISLVNYYHDKQLALPLSVFLDGMHSELLVMSGERQNLFDIQTTGQHDKIFNGVFYVEDVQIGFRQ
ncbi:MAG: hypothetical protein ACI8WB_000693 [Phenylobacterium sp.]|jgi:hypothetical protein